MHDSDSARRVIDAHERLSEVNLFEPNANDEGESQAWLAWHSHYYLPASAEWRAAVIAFQGPDGSFHPANVLPAARSARSV